MLRLVLHRHRALRIVVRGPSPSCAIVGALRASGRIGVNRLFFRGRVHHRRLDAGTYTLTVLPLSRAERIVVRVTERGDAIPLRTSRAADIQCAGAAATASPAISLGAAIRGASALTALGVLFDTRSAGAAPERGADPVSHRKKKSGTLAATATKFEPLGLVPGFGGDGGHGLLPMLAGLALLATLALTFAAMVTFVVRFLRGSWNP